MTDPTDPPETLGLQPGFSDPRHDFTQLKAIFDTAVDGIIAIDASGQIERYNNAAEKMFGWSAAEVIGRNVSCLMPPAMAAEHDRYISDHLETGAQKIIGIGRRVTGRRRDGSEFPLHLSVGKYHDGDARFFVAILHDLTQVEAEQRRIRDLQHQLNVIGQHSAVSEMGAALAHELNQPLTAIDLFTIAAERALATDPARAAELFARVRAEVARAGGIIRRIRQMVERGDGEPAFFPLSSVIDSAVDLCRVVDPRGESTIFVTAPPEVELFGDEIQIRQILVNLIKNALDATHGQADRRIEISARIAEKIEIEVRDNGPGVPTEFIPSLFSAFATTKADGLGIGLSICQGIAEAHGGRLSYLPRRDGQSGAVFRLMLPKETIAE